jgi:VWFA-related protein
MKDRATFSRRSLLAALGLFPAARLLRGQQQTQPAQQPPATFSTNVKVVNVFATVRDKQGHVVNDLTQNDFLLDEDGRAQVIRYFSRETDLPLTLGLLVDTSGSQRNVLADERLASYHFLDKMMREDKDMAFVIHFDFEVELLEDLTSSRQTLRKALDELEIGTQRRQQGNQGGTGNSGGGYPGGGGYPQGRGRGGRGGGGTDLYDAVYLGADEIMRKQHGRKAMIILSDGVDTGSKLSLSAAVESAQRSDTLVYAILFSDPDAYGGMGMPGGFGGRRRGMGGGMPPGRGMGNTEDGKKVLQRISTETGGRFFEVSKRMPIDKVYEAIEEDLRSQYSIGYTPEGGANNSEYRRIHLTTKQKGLAVQTREGYYPS